jgi:hypothetical protein
MSTNSSDLRQTHSAWEDKKDVEGRQSEVQIPVYNNLELVSETDLSFAAIIKGTAAKPLNTFEKKAALINLELDRFGLGRYQICIWFLCGFGYFLDLAWAQGVGLIATAVYQEMGVADADTGNIFAIANAGLAVGALGFGLAVDVIGRKWAFNLTCLITSVFGLLLVRCQMSVTSSFRTRANVPCHRLLRSTTTAQSVASTFWPRLDSEVTSQSMLPSLSSSCPRTGASWSRFFPCGNPLA